MKKLILSLFLFPSLLMAQNTLFNVNFSGTFPPTGWTIDAHAANWSAVSTNNAGGTAPEARLNYSPTFTGDSRLISPTINTSGNTILSDLLGAAVAKGEDSKKVLITLTDGQRAKALASAQTVGGNGEGKD